LPRYVVDSADFRGGVWRREASNIHPHAPELSLASLVEHKMI
jgi:hypothetical protein